MKHSSLFIVALLLTGCPPGQTTDDTGETVDPEDQRARYELSPASAGVGTAVEVAVEATRSTFIFGDTWLDLGEGITVDTVTVKDGFTTVAELTIDPNADVGPRDVLVTIGELEITLEEAFTLIDESFIVDPSDGKMGETLDVAFVGRGTTWEQGYTWTSFGPGVQILDFNVLTDTLAEARVAIHPDAPPGPRDVAMEDGPKVVTLYDGFIVDRAVITAFWEPDEICQGDTEAFTIIGLDTHFTLETDIEFWDDGGKNADIVVTEMTWLDDENVYGRIRASNAARIGSRDVLINSGDETILVPDAISVCDSPPDLSNLYPGINFDVAREIDNNDGTLHESVSAFAYFLIPLDPPCGPPPPPMMAGPMPYDQNGVFGVPPEPEPVDCPNPETVSVGEFVWYEGPENVVTLHRDEIMATGQIVYQGIDLTLDDYHFNQLYDLHAPGDEDYGVPEFLVPEVQPTVPADYYITAPELWGDFTWPRSEELPLAWTPAQTYPDAIFNVSINGILVADGEPGYAGVLPWDDGEHQLTPSELSGLEASPVSFAAASFIEGPYFGLPFSTIQIAKSDSTLSTAGYMILE